MLKNHLLVTFLLALFAPLAAGASELESSIHVAEAGQAIELTVPASKLVITLRKDGFQLVQSPSASGAMANPRYFQFHDATRGVRLSGWFEPAGRFDGVIQSIEVREKP